MSNFFLFHYLITEYNTYAQKIIQINKEDTVNRPKYQDFYF